MRIKAKLCWLVLVVIVQTACKSISTDMPIAPLPSTPTQPAISPSPSKTITPPSSLTPTFTPTVTAVSPDDIKWVTYVFDVGVSFEYPHNWIIMTSREDKDSVEFVVTSYLPYNVSVDVYDRPVADAGMSDPHSWEPNEGNYEVLWEKPISIDNADGLEFIWGIPAETHIGGVLFAIYYSEQRELQVVLRTDADAIPTESNRFGVFEYMVQSMRIAP